MVSQDVGHGIIVNYLSFDKAENHGLFGALPTYTEELKNPNNLFEYSLDITPIKEDTLSATETAQLTDKDLLTDTYQFVIEPQDQYARLVLVPLRYEKEADLVIKLGTFKVNAEPRPVGEPQQANF